MDHLNLAKAYRLMDGDKDLFRDLFVIIEKSLPEKYGNIEKALKKKSETDLELYAHQLKGALRNVAADPACELLFQLEKCGMTGDFETAEALYQQVKPAVSQMLAEFHTRKWEAVFAEFSRSGIPE